MTDPGFVQEAINSPEGQRLVKEHAAALTRAKEISDRSDKIYDAAVQEFGSAKLDKALNNFRAFDGMKVELAEALLDTPEAHKVLHEIASSPDLIDRLYKMSPAKMVAEVARMGERAATAKKEADRKAAGDRGGDAQAADAWRDPDVSMADFMKGREADLAAKRKAQRGGVRVY